MKAKKITKHERKSTVRNHVSLAIIGSSLPLIQMGDRSYVGANPQYADRNFGTGLPLDLVKVRKGTPFTRLYL